MDSANLICQVLFNSNQVSRFINVVFPTGSLNGIKSFLELIQSMRIRLGGFKRFSSVEAKSWTSMRTLFSRWMTSSTSRSTPSKVLNAFRAPS